MIDQDYINHFAFVLDASPSMRNLVRDVITVADNQIEHLALRSKELDQETRATIYTFHDRPACVYYDKDVLRLPKLGTHYQVGGRSTALIDAAVLAIEDLKKTATLYGDHAFVVYILTDGQENSSRAPARQLRTLIETLPDNWTLAALVPDKNGAYEAGKLGFGKDNIQIWETTSRGVTEVGSVIRTASDNFMTQRAVGVRSMRNLFTVDTSQVKLDQLTKVPEAQLTRLHVGPFSPVQIAQFVEASGVRFKLGGCFYQLTKTEEIQPQKEVAIMDQKGDVFTGRAARSMLNLPDYTVKVSPDINPLYTVFIQSTSTNRKLVPGTQVLILR